jgi:hypothetical protein
MRHNPILRSGTLILMVLCACAPLRLAVPPLPATPTGEASWTVILGQSGGIVGVDRTVQVTSNGQLVASDGRSGKRVSTQLHSESIAEVNRLYDEAVSAQRAPHDSTCADCFEYDLELVSDTGTVHISLDDTNLADSGVEPLIAYLLQLRDAALAGP